jgi:hypothetical protein
MLTALVYLGLFLLPLFGLLVTSETDAPPVRWFKKWMIRAILPLSALVGAVVLFTGELMPLTSNIISEVGIGPLTLHDVYALNLPNAGALPSGFWTTVTIGGVIGAATLLMYGLTVVRFWVIAFVRQPRGWQHDVRFFLLVGTAVYFAPMLFLGFYDRYLLSPLLLVSLLLMLDQGCLPRLKRTLPFLGLFLPIAYYSVAGTHDYLAWNRARWQALRYVSEHQPVPYHQIDGGFEYNGLMLYTDESLRAKKTDKWWTQADDRYVITFGRIEDYEVVQRYEYNRWLPPASGQIFVLKLPLTP